MCCDYICYGLVLKLWLATLKWVGKRMLWIGFSVFDLIRFQFENYLRGHVTEERINHF
jgi:hypothetical protein